MNNSEFKKGQEVWVNFKVKNPVIDREGEIRIVNESGCVICAKPEEITTAITEKPEIPQYVADKIEYCNNTGGYNLFHAMDYCFQFKDSADWLEDNQELFARAWFYGYNIEKTKLHIVQIGNVKLFKCVSDNHTRFLFASDIMYLPDGYDCEDKLTEEEIKKMMNACGGLRRR